MRRCSLAGAAIGDSELLHQARRGSKWPSVAVWLKDEQFATVVRKAVLLGECYGSWSYNVAEVAASHANFEAYVLVAVAADPTGYSDG